MVIGMTQGTINISSAQDVQTCVPLCSNYTVYSERQCQRWVLIDLAMERGIVSRSGLIDTTLEIALEGCTASERQMETSGQRGGPSVLWIVREGLTWD